MKGIKRLFLGLIFTAFAIVSISGTALAGGGSKVMIVEIPFDFYVKNEKLAAGKYEVQKNSENVFILRRAETGEQIILVSQITLGMKEKEPERIIFNRYGNEYFLRSLYWNRKANGRDLGESKTEKNIRKNEDERQLAEKSKPKAVSVLFGK